MMAAVLLVPAAAPAQVIGFTSGVTAGEVTAHTAIVWGRTDHPAFVVSQVAKDPKFRNLVRQRSLQATTGQQQHGPDAVRRLRAEHHLPLPLLLPGRQEVQRGGQVRDRAEPPAIRRRSGSPTRATRRRLRRPGRPSPSTATSRPSRRWPPRTTTSTSTSATRSTRTPRSPGAPTASTVRAEVGACTGRSSRSRTCRRSARRPASTTTGTTTSSSTTSRSPRTGAPLYDRGVQAFRDYSRSPTASKNGIYRTLPLGQEPRALLPRRALVPKRQGVGEPRLRQPGHRPAGPGADRAAEHPQRCSRRWSRRSPSRVSQACKNKINSPDRTFLGSRSSTGSSPRSSTRPRKWKVVMNEDPDPAVLRAAVRPLGGLRVRAREAAEGAPERERDHLVFLTTDTHAAFANVVRYRTLTGDVGARPTRRRRPVRQPVPGLHHRAGRDQELLAGDRRHDRGATAAAS